jgi:hypothetical protein
LFFRLFFVLLFFPGSSHEGGPARELAPVREGPQPSGDSVKDGVFLFCFWSTGVERAVCGG